MFYNALHCELSSNCHFSFHDCVKLLGNCCAYTSTVHLTPFNFRAHKQKKFRSRSKFRRNLVKICPNPPRNAPPAS